MQMFKIAILSSMLILSILTQDTFDAFKLRMEKKVKYLAERMSVLDQEQCNSSNSQCKTSSYYTCDGTAQQVCIDDFPKQDGCASDGSLLSETSGILFPRATSKNVNSQQKFFACASAQLDRAFSDISENRNQQFTFAYVGSNTGGFRVYPSFKWNSCPDFDPRIRPWYVTASSGSKNIILFIDVSGSMAGFKLQTAKQALKSVINTLSSNDFVAVIKFSQKAQVLVNSKLTRATLSAKAQLLDAIDSLKQGGSTNYELAFKKSFEILNQSVKDQFGSPCQNTQNLFLFLTDGKPSQGIQTSAQLINFIDKNKADKRIRLFTYGFGSQSEIDSELLQQMSCKYEGITFFIPSTASGSELINKMTNYYKFIGEGIKIQNPIWSEPFDDAFQYGRIFSVAMPIYENSKVQTILGVAGIDVLMSTFQKYGLSTQEQIKKKLLSNLPCHEGTLTECDLESLRDDFLCNIENCTQNNGVSSRQCTSILTSNIFANPISTNEQACCGLTTGAIIGIIVGALAFIILLVILICYLVRRRKKKNKKMEDPESKPPQNQQRIDSNRELVQRSGGNVPAYFNRMQNQDEKNKKKKYENPYDKPDSYILS